MLVVFLPIFVVDRQIISGHDFVVPLTASFISILTESKSVSPNYSFPGFLGTALRQNKVKSLDYQRCSENMRNRPFNFINRGSNPLVHETRKEVRLFQIRLFQIYTS